jgi:hypothetical protein
VTFGIGLGPLPLSRESRGDVSDMVVEVQVSRMPVVCRGGWLGGGVDGRCVSMVNNVASRLLFRVLNVLRSICPGYVRKVG